MNQQQNSTHRTTLPQLGWRYIGAGDTPSPESIEASRRIALTFYDARLDHDVDRMVKLERRLGDRGWEMRPEVAEDVYARATEAQARADEAAARWAKSVPSVARIFAANVDASPNQEHAAKVRQQARQELSGISQPDVGPGR